MSIGAPNPNTTPVEHPPKNITRNRFGSIQRIWPWILLVLIGFAWGAAFSLAKMATEGGAHPLGITYWQALLGAILLVSFTLILRKPFRVEKNFLVLYLVCGLLGSVVPGILYFYAASHVSPGVLAITIATVPIFTFLAATVLGIEQGSIIRIIGVLVGILSIFLLIIPTEGLTDRSSIPWVLAAIGASVCYAGENLVIALRLPKNANPFLVVGGMLVAATLVMTPFVFITGTFVPLVWPWGRSEWAIVGMAALNLFCYGLFLQLIMRAGPVFASQSAYLITISGVCWGILIFNDEHTVWVWASLAVMLAALALVTPRKEHN
jgi:drug/metabolite transporter (DMT)-like permease